MLLVFVMKGLVICSITYQVSHLTDCFTSHQTQNGLFWRRSPKPISWKKLNLTKARIRQPTERYYNTK